MTKWTDNHVDAIRQLVTIAERHRPELTNAEAQSLFRLKTWLRDRDEKPLGPKRLVEKRKPRS